MSHQIIFKNKYCRTNSSVFLFLLGIVGLAFYSCSPQINIVSTKSYPPREDDESVVFYRKEQDIPIESKKIGTLTATCTYGMKDCDSVSIFSLSEAKILKKGGNALLINEFKKPTLWNNFRFWLNGDVLLISDFSYPPDNTMSSHKDKFGNFKEKYMYVGFGAGPETGLSLLMPKLSYYNFQNRKNLSTYYGIEGSYWIIIAQWMSLDFLYGVKKNIFTFDTSIGVWWYPKLDNKNTSSEVVGPYFHSTLNPKIGVKLGRVWLKGGPSIFLYKNYPKDQGPIGITDMIKIGHTLCNFEILIKLN